MDKQVDQVDRMEAVVDKLARRREVVDKQVDRVDRTRQAVEIFRKHHRSKVVRPDK